MEKQPLSGHFTGKFNGNGWQYRFYQYVFPSWRRNLRGVEFTKSNMKTRNKL
uniref:Uncharacterized protein n=1 Tax=Manihot esculenta TaxID=3983 RepID=A0A2C9VKY0_MANES